MFYLFPQVYGLQSAAEVYSGKAMHSLFVRNNTRPIPWSEISPVTLGVSIWHFVGWQSFGAIKSLFYIFVTFSSLFLIGRINRELRAVKRAIVLNSECHDEPSSKEVRLFNIMYKLIINYVTSCGPFRFGLVLLK